MHHKLTIKTPRSAIHFASKYPAKRRRQPKPIPAQKFYFSVSRNQSASRGSNIVATMTLQRLAIEKR
jgi:hypothetical protein